VAKQFMAVATSAFELADFFEAETHAVPAFGRTAEDVVGGPDR